LHADSIGITRDLQPSLPSVSPQPIEDALKHPAAKIGLNAGGIVKRSFKVAFFACGFIGLFLNLALIFALFSREAGVSSALETAMEALWIGGATFFGLGALILEDH
jgi:hypothetical protein